MEKRGRKTLTRLLYLLIAINILAGFLFARVVYRDTRKTRYERDALAVRAGVRDDMSTDEAQERYALLAADAMRFVSLAGEMEVRDGRVRVLLGNDAQNTCALTLTLTLLETEETILRTELVEPGYYIESVQTDVLPAPGKYVCIARVAFYDVDTGLPLGQAGRHVLLKIAREDAP